MNINKKLLIIFMMLFLSPLTIYADEKPNLDDEELPAIDPFKVDQAPSLKTKRQLEVNHQVVVC